MVSAQPIIIPAILTDSESDFQQKITVIAEFSSIVHIDILDNTLVSGQTIDLGIALRHQPINLKYEFHFMTKEPLESARQVLSAGAVRAIVHAEAFGGQDLSSFMNEYVFAFNPETELEIYQNYSFSKLMLMSVHPGAQGQSFIPETITKIHQCRSLFAGAEIEIDGGIKPENLSAVAEAGANRFVMGSAIIGASDPAGVYRACIQLTQKE